MLPPDSLRSSHPLFILAHPDDEAYCCCLMNSLIRQGSVVSVAYITSGDSGGNPDGREIEARLSMREIGVDEHNIFFLCVSEQDIFDSLSEIVSSLCKIASKSKADCIIGQDYEGGHEVHDAASFCAAEVVQRQNIQKHIMFPLYHGKPNERRGARFKPERTGIIELPLDEQGGDLKRRVLASHVSQQGHFECLQQASSDYEQLLFSREVFVVQDQLINFQNRPTKIIGYEFHRNGFTFNTFQKTITSFHERTS